AVLPGMTLGAAPAGVRSKAMLARNRMAGHPKDDLRAPPPVEGATEDSVVHFSQKSGTSIPPRLPIRGNFMRQAIRLLCVVLLTAVPLVKATADMSPEMYFLAWEIKRNFEIDSTQTTRGPDCRDDCFRQASEALREMIKAQAV